MKNQKKRHVIHRNQRKTTKKPAKTVYSTARQLIQWIPEGLIGTSPAFNCGRKHRKFLNRFKASIHAIDSKRASALCAGLKTGDILLGDRAYVDFVFLNDLRLRGVHFVLRLKRNIKVRTVRKLAVGKTARKGSKGVTGDRIVKRVKPKTLGVKTAGVRGP